MFKEGLTKKALSLGTALTLSVACVLTSFSTSPAETKAATIPGMSFLSDEINNGDNTTGMTIEEVKQKLKALIDETEKSIG